MLKEAIASKLQMAVSDFRLVVRQPNIPHLHQLPDSTTLHSLGLRNGDLILVDEKVTEETPKTEPRPSDSPTTRPIVEDEVDTVIRKQDGWIKRPRSRFCTHGERGTCSHCCAIPPWNIAQHPDFENLNIKHIPFHAWLREKQYRNANNPVVLEDPTYKMDLPTGDKATLTSAFNYSVTLERQPFRHVDHVEFDSPTIMDKFIAGWRESGQQRCGFLFGRYIPDPTIPLGIRAVVSAIYEPPQKIYQNRVVLLKDKHDAQVCALAKQFNLEKIGFIWTSLKVDENKQIIPDRDENLYLTSIEVIRMGLLQQRYPSKCQNSTSGYFGSKFISILVYGNNNGGVDIAAYQISNQIVRLIRDGVVISAKEPQLLKVRKSTKNIIYPDIFYNAKNEYGVLQTMKADPYFPNEYGIISLRHSFPKQPNPLFTSFEFPIENRSTSSILQTKKAVLDHFQKYNGSSFFARLKDFHLLLYIQILNPNIAKQIIDAILNNTKTEHEIKALLQRL